MLRLRSPFFPKLFQAQVFKGGHWQVAMHAFGHLAEMCSPHQALTKWMLECSRDPRAATSVTSHSTYSLQLNPETCALHVCQQAQKVLQKTLTLEGKSFVTSTSTESEQTGRQEASVSVVTEEDPGPSKQSHPAGVSDEKPQPPKSPGTGPTLPHEHTRAAPAASNVETPVCSHTLTFCPTHPVGYWMLLYC